MAAGVTLPLKDDRAQITRDGCRLGNDAFEAGDVTSFGSVARTFGPSRVVKIGLFVLGFLALSSAVRGIMTSYWIAAVLSTVLAVPLFLMASLKATRVLTVELRDGRRIEYVGTSDHIERVEAAIGMATMTDTAGTPVASGS
jgi:hypothetical protein